MLVGLNITFRGGQIMRRVIISALCAATLMMGATIGQARTVTDSAGKVIPFDFEDFPEPGPIQRYKGKILVGSSYPDVKNGGFFDTVKIAIDLTEQLPTELRKNIDLIQVIIYDPPSNHRDKNDEYTNTTGVYTLGSNLFQPAPVIMYRDLKWVAPVDIAYSLVGNAVSARRHRTMMDLKRRMDALGDETDPEYKKIKAQFEEMAAAVLKTDQAIVDRYRCEPMLAIFGAMKVWERDPSRRDAFARDLSSRKCW